MCFCRFAAQKTAPSTGAVQFQLNIVIDVFDERADLRLRELSVCADSLALYAHLVIDKRREQVNRDTTELGILLDQLCQVMAVHLRHLNITDEAGDMLCHSAAKLLMTADVVPRVSAVVKMNNVIVACFVQSVYDKSIQER